MMGIYCYVDTMDNSVVYVGKDSNIDKGKRRKDHLYPSNYHNQPFNRILQNNSNRYQYKEIFVFDDITDTELNQLEMQQIALFNPKFNFTKGGDGVRGFKLSDEAKRKMSESLKGRKLPLETRKKMSEARKGRSFSKDTLKKMSENNARYWKGKTFSQEHWEKLIKGCNTSGIYRVSKHKNKRFKQGFIWTYIYFEDGKRKELASVDLKKLEEKVKAKGLEWYKLEEVEE